MKEKVVVAMSGGVDSSVTAALLLEQGYDVSGVMLKLWKYTDFTNNDLISENGPSESASIVAKKLGISFELIDAEELFKRKIVDEFVRQYEHGFTPNPCFRCNQVIKWGFLLDVAKKMGADALATGHYARINKENGLFHLIKGIDNSKDQSYVLAGLTQEQLQYALLPLGQFSKSNVKQIAKQYGLVVADRPESQDLCFLPDGNYRKFLSSNGSITAKPGLIRSISGEIIGEHQGLIHYTIGQRKGLGSGLGVPYYVVSMDAENNELIIGKKEDLGSKKICARNINWILGEPPDTSLQYQVKIRYKATPTDCKLTSVSREKMCVVTDNPVRDATPGQFAVIYNQDEVIGSAEIHSTERE